MSKMIIHPQSCKSCEYCVANCPKKAITLDGPINKAGYPTPVVDQKKCVICGTCYNVCPDYVYEFTEGEK